MAPPTNIPARLVFAANFKAAREASGLTHQEVSVKTRTTPAMRPVSMSTISGVERGVQNVTIDVAERLAQAVNESLHNLLDPEPRTGRRRRST